jgi:hypothetical protein
MSEFSRLRDLPPGRHSLCTLVYEQRWGGQEALKSEYNQHFTFTNQSPSWSYSFSAKGRQSKASYRLIILLDNRQVGQVSYTVDCPITEG